jgi:hypothetical protein
MSIQELNPKPSASETSASVKQQIDEEWRDLVEIIKQREADQAKDIKPVGILGRWLHTSTS